MVFIPQWRRVCLSTVAVCAFLGYAPTRTDAQHAVRPFAQDHVVVYESPNPRTVHCYTPGVAILPSGRLIATLDVGGIGASFLPGVVTKGADGKTVVNRGKVFTSDDRGRTWTHRGNFPFAHARPFTAGKSLYILGQAGDLVIFHSDDDGETWSGPFTLTDGEFWHQSACNVHYANGCVYLVMERRAPRPLLGWEVAVLAPVLMRARVDADLTKRKSWTFASELVFEDAIDYRALDYFGVPFFSADARLSIPVAWGRAMAPIGWLETNVVQFVDPDHVWFDPKGKTFHLWMRAHTGGTNLAAICKVVENDDGAMTTMLECAPSGKTVAYVPCPGGQMRFHVLYDKESRLYWLLSSQSTDSMRRAGRLPVDRFGLPNNERHRLQLHFSRNMIDWCFAGIVAIGKTPRQARHYASMVIDGDDLHILSRSGDDRAKSAHDGNLITFHTVRNFRDLVY